MKIARVEAGDNWDPEPAGWARLAAVLHNSQHVGLEAVAVKLAAGSLNDFKVAHLTGTTRFTLNDEQRQEIKAFVGKGGTLLVDAAGGSADFAGSAQGELGQIFGLGKQSELDRNLPDASPVYNAPLKIKEVSYRRYARKSLVGNAASPRLRGLTVGGRLAVIFSREDLSAGLLGKPVDGIIGYEPQSATDMMTNMVVFAAQTPPPEPPAPIERPDLYDGPGKPRIAVFAKAGETYAIGCPDLSVLLGRHSKAVDGESWAKIVRQSPIAASLHCNGEVQAYVDESNSQRYIVVKHGDGPHCHKVDSDAWFAALKCGEPTRTSLSEIQKVAPKEGHAFATAF